MTKAPAIEQAIALLRDRRDEAHQAVMHLNVEIKRLREEIDQIERALDNLGARDTVTPIRPPQVEAGPAAIGSASDPYEGLNVTTATKRLLEAERGPWTPSLVRERLNGTSVQGDRDEATFIAAIRTAFHSLRSRGLVVTDGKNRTMAAKWAAARDAEAPAGTGASVSEEPEEGSSRKEGGSVDSGTEPPSGRDGSDNAELRHGHGDRAPLVGVSG